MSTRIAVPPMVLDYPRASGVGNMWHEVVRELRRDDDVRALVPGAPRTRLWRPQVWMHDGHQGPLSVRTPVVAQLHEAAWADVESRAALDPEWVERYEGPSRDAAQRAARIVTPSASSRRQIVVACDVPDERVVVAPHGVDAGVFSPGLEGGEALVNAAGGAPGRPYVLFVSQLHPRKNLGVLREAMAVLGRRGYPHELVVVGGPAVDRPDAMEVMHAALAPLSDGSAVMHLTGLEDAQLAAVMAGASAFCLPSLMEGFGLTALEAMACGTPVVVSDRGALPEVVGDAGLVVAPDVDAVSGALERVLSHDDLAARLSTTGRARAEQFTWSATASYWRRAVEEALG